MASRLVVEGLVAGYAEAVMLDGIDLDLAAGERLAILGRNGVGKTTLLRALIGLARQRSGRIALDGRALDGLAPHDRAAAGLGWVPQERFVFPSLTVHEHLEVAARPGPWNAERLYALFPALAARRENTGGKLSGGEQQMLAIARALATNPRVLLLDEPLEGLAPVVARDVARALGELAGSDMSIVLVEQHARIALELTDRAVALDRGRIVLRSASRDLLGDADTLARIAGVA